MIKLGICELRSPSSLNGLTNCTTRSWNIMKLSPGTSFIEKVYTGQRLTRTYGAPVITRLRGNLAILYQQLWGLPLGTLTIFFTDEGKSVTVNYVSRLPSILVPF